MNEINISIINIGVCRCWGNIIKFQYTFATLQSQRCSSGITLNKYQVIFIQNPFSEKAANQSP
ncbi:hypothetical protein [Pectobacterium brasiliense]|uniref:hypothetical protein n=1 Tax=Pectobacterium brasiliense TaxID=180957 RepID=UPI001F42279D|nr:hypothetical protein [Pectobacterium brasiliense]